jgi:MoaA/NifB/PqqE/SkfB family radical SAM enzyme
MSPAAPSPESATREHVIARDWRPRTCVWELTLACNLRCRHCGSRAGHVRPGELSTAECLDVACQLATLGTELVTLSGGEPTLRRDWDQIARTLVTHGVRVNMVTNGVYRDREAADDVARRARAAGLCNIAVSIDGPRDIHDGVRGEGTFDAAFESVEVFRAAGLPVTLMTTVSRRNLHALEAVRDLALAAGVEGWRLQLAKPMGTMDAHRDEVIAPRDLLYLVPLLARMKLAVKPHGLTLTVGDSIGYYGPHDDVLRGRGWRGRDECWRGCQAGLQAIGIQADGGVKGCLSLRADAHGEPRSAHEASSLDGETFVEGNVRRQRLDAIWYRPGAFAYNREFQPRQLTGACAACSHGALCRGGARCVSAAVAGTLTEDPLCFTAQRIASSGAAAQTGHRAGFVAVVMAAGVAQACETAGSGPEPASDASLQPRDAHRPHDAMSMDRGVLADRGLPVDGGPTTLDGAPVDGDPTTLDLALVPDEGVRGDARPDASAPADLRLPDIRLPDIGGSVDAAPPPPDLSPPAPDAAIDCAQVCCACEYGVLPPEVWETCCAPCVNVCCDCDYGMPPPPQCCP